MPIASSGAGHLAPGCSQKPGLGAFLVGGESLAHYQTSYFYSRSDVLYKHHCCYVISSGHSLECEKESQGFRMKQSYSLLFHFIFSSFLLLFLPFFPFLFSFPCFVPVPSFYCFLSFFFPYYLFFFHPPFSSGIFLVYFSSPLIPYFLFSSCISLYFTYVVRL